MRRIIAIMLNLTCAGLVLYSVSTFFRRSGVGNMQVPGWKCLNFFTIDSNLLAAAGCLVLCGYLLWHPLGELPRWLYAVKLVCAAAVSVTMLTVLFFLGPTQGYGPMFEGVNLHLHLICPLLCILSFLLLEHAGRQPLLLTLLGALPVALYGCIYLVQVVVRSAWQDFYGFNRGGVWPLSMVLMLAAAWAVTLLLWWLNGLCGLTGKG